MQFQFDSVAAFLHMAGHGPYVWSCYLITALALIYLVAGPIRRQRQLLTQLRRQARIDAHEQQSRQPGAGQ